jgi:glycosyltransferase involved in cell wall biosynthesis
VRVAAGGRAADEPLISVVMPFYNVGDYLREAVESVWQQSYPHWELLLVDDGSVDESSRIARDLVRLDRRLTYLHHDHWANRGASSSRNLGLARAEGDLIAFLDSDDVWMADKLAHQVSLFQQFPELGMICGASQYWNSWSDPQAVDRVVEVGCQQNTVFQPKELVKILYPLQRRHAPSMNGLLVKQRVVKEINGFVDGFRGMYDDQVFLTKVYLSYPVYVTDKIYDRYRQNRTGSLCHTSILSGDYLTHRLHYLRWLREYLKNNKIKDFALDYRILREELKCRFPILEKCIYRLDRKGRAVRSKVRQVWKRSERI